nr:tetratricopeptide repeat protein [Cytophagales bacterium]
MRNTYFEAYRAIRRNGPWVLAHVVRMEYVYLFLLLSSLDSFAQMPALDSLRKEIKRLETADSFAEDRAYVSLLNAFSESFYNYNPDSTLFYGLKSKKISENIRYSEGLADAYRNIGAYYNRNGNYDTAKVIFQRGIQLANEESYKAGLANLYGSIGLTYYETGYFAAATEYYLMSLKIKRELGLRAEIANTLNNLGLIAVDRKQLSNALEFFNEAKEIRQELGDNTGILPLDANIALVLQKEQKFDEARNIYEAILADESAAKNKSLRSVSFFNIGEIFVHQQAYDNAISNYTKALELDRELNDRYGISSDLLGLGEVYLRLNQLAKSEQLIEESLALAMESGIKQNSSNGHKLMSQLLEARGDHIGALKHHKLHKTYQDSIFNSFTETVTEDLLIAYGLEKSAFEAEQLLREKELEREKEFAKLIRNGVIILLLIMSLALYFTLRSYQIQRRARLMATAQKNELERLYLETNRQKEEIESIANDLEEVNNSKDKLFSIVGHDLRSPINSLNSLMQYTMDENLSQQEFLKISYKLKNEVEHVHFTLINLLHWAKSQMSGISTYPDRLNLNELVKENVDLYKPISVSKKITVIDSMAANSVAWADREQINLVIRNLLNNALKFTPEGGKIEISSRLNQENQWEISLKDSGTGMGPDVLSSLFKPNFHVKRYGTSGEKGTGLGLILVKDFLTRNHGTIEVSSEIEKGSTFTFTIPAATSDGA